MQFLIRERMRGMPEPISIKSRGALLLELARELRELKEELEERRYGMLITRPLHISSGIYLNETRFFNCRQRTRAATS